MENNNPTPGGPTRGSADLLSDLKPVVDDAALQPVKQAYYFHLMFARRAELHFTPKHHLTMHLILRIGHRKRQ